MVPAGTANVERLLRFAFKELALRWQETAGCAPQSGQGRGAACCALLTGQGKPCPYRRRNLAILEANSYYTLVSVSFKSKRNNRFRNGTAKWVMFLGSQNSNMVK